MTTLNQAFLRAYTRDRAATVPGPHISVGSQSGVPREPQAEHTPTRPQSPQSPQSPESPQSSVSRASTTFVPPTLLTPPPSLNPLASPAPALAASPSEPQESLRATHAGEAAAAEVFTAAWEADELPWSEVCDQLRDASGPELLAAIARWRSTLSGGTAPNAGAAVNSGADDAHEWPAPLVLGVTSLIRREGRTTVVAGLARAAVAAGLRVALLDADLENPRLSAAAEVAIDATWVDCVVGDAPLSEAAIRCSADGFHLFPLGVAAKQSTFHWNAPSGLRMFRSLRRHFDLCLLDMGPLTDALKRGLQGGADSPLDGVLLLRDVRITGADQVLLIARELHQAGLPIVGVVDNFNDISEQSRCMKATGS